MTGWTSEITIFINNDDDDDDDMVVSKVNLSAIQLSSRKVSYVQYILRIWQINYLGK